MPKDRCMDVSLLPLQTPNSIAQLILVSLVAVLHLLWFLFLRPMEQMADAASELFTSIVEILTYAGGLTLVVLARSSSGGGDPNTFLVISRAMLIFQGAGFAVFMLTQMSSIYWTFKGIAENRRKDKVEQRFRDIKGCPSYQQVVVKRFANRWLNRVLQRPLSGWPRLGPWTLEEQALVLTLIEYYYQQTNGSGISEKLLRDLPKSLDYPFVWSVVGECRSCLLVPPCRPRRRPWSAAHPPGSRALQLLYREYNPKPGDNVDSALQAINAKASLTSSRNLASRFATIVPALAFSMLRIRMQGTCTPFRIVLASN